MKLSQIPLSQIRLVIFDLDGTFYNLGKMRKRVIRDMVFYYLLRPHRWREMRWIQTFRSVREKMAEMPHARLDESSYENVAARTTGSPEEVHQVVNRWMLQHPLPYLAQMVYPEVRPLLKQLKQSGIELAVFSDFPAQKKIKAMGLEISAVYSAHHPEIDQLKPSPKGLLHISQSFGVPPEQCLMVGDRDDRDGEAARRAGMNYHVLAKNESPLQPLLDWVGKH
jgi:HAD superfamily hydrolase (TIGR01509 family)